MAQIVKMYEAKKTIMNYKFMITGFGIGGLLGMAANKNKRMMYGIIGAIGGALVGAYADNEVSKKKA